MKFAAKLSPLVVAVVVAACSELTAVRPIDSHSGRIKFTTAVEPSSVTIASTFQSELGCGGDWDPGCDTTNLNYDAEDGIWQRALLIPAGSYEYKAALNGTWDENYGGLATFNGANIPLTTSGGIVKFYYDNNTHWVTDNVNSVIAVVPGSFQSELGCQGDWDPSCFRSWLQDPDGDGIYTFTTSAIPAGNWEAKVALNESWDVNYGADSVPNGANIQFNVPADGTPMVFTYDPATHILTIAPQTVPVEDQIADLEAAIDAMGLQSGIETSLTAKLNALKAALAADDSTAACQALTDLKNFTNAQRGKRIPSLSADAIMSQAGEIADALGC